MPAPEKHSLITYYNISYVPTDCFSAESRNILVPVSKDSQTNYSHNITGLHTGMNYIISVTAVNSLGKSRSVSVVRRTTQSCMLITLHKTFFINFSAHSSPNPIVCYSTKHHSN